MAAPKINPKTGHPEPARLKVEDVVETMSMDEIGGWVMVGLQVMALIGLGASLAAAWPLNVPAWGVIFIGLAMLAWSASSLGKSLKAHPEPNGDGLKSQGPYAWIRHPMYLGMIVVGLGICIASDVKAYVPFALLILVLLSKIGIEERRLAANYEDWTEYKARTKKLIPRVW